MDSPDTAARAPDILVFDSGLGGLTVLAAVKTARPDARLVYAADDAAFPYGDFSEAGLVARVTLVMDHLIARFSPDLVVIACNTASTLVLPVLRERFALPFVGTVPAIKPAAAQSQSRMISVLATPGTVARDYTRALAETYAFHCEVTLCGSPNLAAFAEAEMRGQPGPDAGISAAIAPCFVERNGKRTDYVVLACTHYPLLLKRFEALAPWPVTWIDPAPAIARRADHVLTERGFAFHGEHRASAANHRVVFTSGLCPTGALERALSQRGLGNTHIEPVPLAS